MSSTGSGTAPAETQARSGELGLLACTALVVGNMIGSGVFLLPAALAAYGPIATLGWIVTSAGAIVLAIVFGRLARLVPATGGPYAYSRAGFGEFPGFLVAWGYWITLWTGNAGVAVAFAGYVGYFFPEWSQNSLFGLSVALAGIWLLTLVNVRGVKEAGAVQIVTTLLKIVPLILIAVVGLAYVDPARFTPWNTSGSSDLSAVAACAALTLWAFLGLESATVPAGNVRHPEVTIPRATIVGTVFAAALYILVTIVAFGAIPLSELAQSSAPLAVVASAMWGSVGGILVAIGACVSTFGTLNGFTLLTGQVPSAAARDGVFPPRFANMSARGTPAFALIVSNLLASGLVAMSFSKGLVDQFSFIILLAALTSLVPYIFCALAELMLYVRDPARYTAPPELVRVALLAAAAFLYSAWAIFGSGQEIVFWGFLLLIAGIPIFVWVKWRAASESRRRTEHKNKAE